MGKNKDYPAHAPQLATPTSARVERRGAPPPPPPPPSPPPAPPAPVHRAAASDGTAGDATAVHRALDTSASNPLPSGVRQKLESSYGTDLGGVRVHDDTAADQAARSVQAHAFATGQDIFFRS